jgi:hypothetical protein
MSAVGLSVPHRASEETKVLFCTGNRLPQFLYMEHKPWQNWIAAECDGIV